MIKTIYILRSAPYDYFVDKEDLYDSFNLMAKRIINPSVNSERKSEFIKTVGEKVLLADLVISAPQKRSIQTAYMINKKVKISKLVDEVGYEMENFISKKDFYFKNGEPNINKARIRFVKALINNHLCEKHESVIKRVEAIFLKLSQTRSKNIVVVSHGFFMKIIEAYLRDKSIKEKPQRLLKYFSGKTETFKFCEGFMIEKVDNLFIFKRYIRRVV